MVTAHKGTYLFLEQSTAPSRAAGINRFDPVPNGRACHAKSTGARSAQENYARSLCRLCRISAINGCKRNFSSNDMKEPSRNAYQAQLTPEEREQLHPLLNQPNFTPIWVLLSTFCFSSGTHAIRTTPLHSHPLPINSRQNR